MFSVVWMRTADDRRHFRDWKNARRPFAAQTDLWRWTEQIPSSQDASSAIFPFTSSSSSKSKLKCVCVCVCVEVEELDFSIGLNHFQWERLDSSDISEMIRWQKNPFNRTIPTDLKWVSRIRKIDEFSQWKSIWFVSRSTSTMATLKRRKKINKERKNELKNYGTVSHLVLSGCLKNKIVFSGWNQVWRISRALPRSNQVLVHYPSIRVPFSLSLSLPLSRKFSVKLSYCVYFFFLLYLFDFVIRCVAFVDCRIESYQWLSSFSNGHN